MSQVRRFGRTTMKTTTRGGAEQQVGLLSLPVLLGPGGSVKHLPVPALIS